MTITSKTCPKCNEEKPVSGFYVSIKRSDGLSSYCRQCQMEDARSRHIPHPRWKAPEGTKYCPGCETVKPLDDFGNNRSSHDGKQGQCRPCAVASVTASRHKDPTSHRRSSKVWREANLERHADNNARFNHGVKHGTYAAMLEAQNGCCAICLTSRTGKMKRFAIDHCHDTKVIRGLLCSCCNTGIGQLKHSKVILEAAVVYLERQLLHVTYSTEGSTKR